MSLAKRDGRWQAEGPGSERAVVALATLEDGQLTFKLNLPQSQQTVSSTAARATAINN